MGDRFSPPPVLCLFVLCCVCLFVCVFCCVCVFDVCLFCLMVCLFVCLLVVQLYTTECILYYVICMLLRFDDRLNDGPIGMRACCAPGASVAT